MTQCWCVYLLVCRDGRTHAGIATDVAARFAAHSGGKGAKFTRSNPPVRVLGSKALLDACRLVNGTTSGHCMEVAMAPCASLITPAEISRGK
jgi:hypothetical protein